MIDSKKNILFICHRIPFPPNKGDKIRTFNEIKYLSQTCTIDLVSFADDSKDLKYQSDLQSYCRDVFIYPLNPAWGKIKGLFRFIAGGSISEGYFFNTKACRKVADLLQQRDYQAVFCFSSPTAEYIIKNKNLIQRKLIKPGLIMDFCDVDSEKWNQYSQNASFPMRQVYKTESKRLLKYEQQINQLFDTSIFVSKNEADLFLDKTLSAKNVVSVSNGVDFDYFSNTGANQSRAGATLMFAGAMDYYANVEGVTWFCKKIFPDIKQAYPAVRFLIVGSNPTHEVQDLGKIEGVEVTGYVEDIRDYYRSADICVIPLRIARGIQNKVLEAMAMEKPLVSTSAAFSGIGADPGNHLIIADDEQSFSQSVKNLLKDGNKANEMGKAARNFVKSDYSWSACLRKLDSIIS